MKKFFALMAVVLAVVSCQKDVDNLDVNVGGAVDTVITVNIPENETRANESGIGVFGNGILDSDDYTMRYIFQVYYNGETNDASRQVMYTDDTSVSFPVRLVPNRDYQFVVWADVVLQDGKSLDELGVYEESADLHYNTRDLENITLNTSTWVAMDETRDAFTASYAADDYNGAKIINIDLYRPFAKLRVVTTDYVALANHGTGIETKTATVKYTTKHRSAFNAYTSKAEAADLSGVEHENYTIATYTLENDAKRTIFSDYFFAENDVVKFEMTVYDTNDDEIVTRVFNTDIYAKRNHLTTLLGNILTDGNDINVEVKPGFGGIENPNINYNVITSGSELLKAIENGGSYMVGNDIYVSAPVASTLATRAAAVEPTTTTTTINLNGYTITVTNKTDAPFATVAAGNTLFLEGGDIVLTEGSTASFIKNNGNVVLSNGTLENESDHDTAAVVEGKVIAEENTNATVNDNNTTKVENWLTDVLANGGTYLFTDDMTAKDIIEVTAENVVLDGNGFTLTSTAGRAINVSGAQNVTIKNLTINASGERAINIIQNATNITIDNVTATAANYTVNVATSAPGAVVAIKNSTLNGLCTVNVSSAEAEVTVDGSTVNCNDNNTTEGESYAALSLNKEAVGGKIIATNSTINVAEGSDSVAGRNGAEDGVVTIDGRDERVVVMNAAITYPGSDYYHAFETIAAAVEFAKGENEISLIRNVELTEPLVIEEGQIATINLNGKTITGSHSKSVGAIIKNEGTLTIVGGTVSSTGANGGSAIQNNGQLIIDGTKIIGSSIRENEGWPSYPINNYGSSIIIKNATITGYQGAIACNTAGTVTLEDCTINKEYLNTSSHVFYINHEEAKVIVNGGTYTHNGMDGSLAYVNKGIITINGGTFNASNGGYGIAALTNGNVVINGGTFNTALLNWGGSISIKGGTFKAEPDASYLATGYKAIEKNGKYVVVPADAEVVSTADELVAALAAGEDVFFMNDITVAASKGGYNKAGILQNKAQTIDGNGYTLTVTGAGATWDCAIYTNGGTIKNLTVAGSFRGIFTAGQNCDLYIENVTFENVVYTFHSDGKTMPANPFGVYVSNSNVNGWTSHSDIHTEVVYTNCSFREGSGYKYCRPYGKTEFINCTFCPGYTVDQSQTTDITFTECTFEE